MMPLRKSSEWRYSLLFAPLSGLASGLLAFAAFPPADFGPVAFVALVPLALLFRRGSAKELALGSTVFSLTFFGLLISWMQHVTMAGYIALVVALTLWVTALLQLGRTADRRLPGWPSWLIFTLAFFAAEYLRSNYPLGGFPWGGFGYSQHDNSVLLRLAPYAGAWGISLVVILINSLIAEGIQAAAAGSFRRRVVHLGLSTLILGAVTASLPGRPLPNGARATVAMVQGNVPEGTVDPHSDDQVVLQNHIQLSRKLSARPPALVVWAEGALDRDPFFHPPSEDALLAVIRQVGAPFLVGAWARHPDGTSQNASLFFDAAGKLQGTYAKRRLVPFGEFVPFRQVLAPVVKDISRVPEDLTPGTVPAVFSLPEGRFASVICYESTYPDLVRSVVRNGARFLVVSTNNSSFGRTAASDQHLVFSQLRAAEHRMWVAHTGVSGISAAIGPDGRILQQSELFRPQLMTPTIRFATQVTPYTRWGDWVPIMALGGLVVIVLAPAVRSFSSWAPPRRRLRSNALRPSDLR